MCVCVLKCETDPSIHFQSKLRVANLLSQCYSSASSVPLLLLPRLLLTPTLYRADSLTSNTKEKCIAQNLSQAYILVEASSKFRY